MKNLELRVGGKYRLKSKIGGGSFGVVYLGIDTESEEEVAIKLEHYKIDPSLLREEIQIYESLAGGPGIPKILWHGSESEYKVMVFELLGPSLEDLHSFCSFKFSLKTVLMLADQLLCRFEFLHSRDVLHRDVKPDNFLMGVGRRGNLVYVTDMGLATTLYERDTWTRPQNPRLVGTARYASVNGHLGAAQSARDDIEALGYMLIDFARGSLPWQGVKATDQQEKYRLILEKKEAVSLDELCDGLPRAFRDYQEHVRSLAFNDKPGYAYLRKIFRSLFLREGFEYDNVFDWTVIKYLMSLPEDEQQQLREQEAQELKEKGEAA